jgi:hypothetical protein
VEPAYFNKKTRRKRISSPTQPWIVDVHRKHPNAKTVNQ